METNNTTPHLKIIQMINVEIMKIGLFTNKNNTFKSFVVGGFF